MKKLFLTTALILSLSAPAYALHPGGTVTVDVNGLVCDFCAQALQKVFGKQEAVESIKVDLDTKVVSIHFNEGHNLDDETITTLINKSGYDVEEIHRGE